MRQRRRTVCTCCGTEGVHHAFGWIDPCYGRWIDAGRPPEGPPRPLTASEGAQRGARARRGTVTEAKIESLEEFAMVLRTRAHEGISIGKAAEAVGRCGRTGTRYMEALREMGHPAVEYWERVTRP